MFFDPTTTAILTFKDRERIHASIRPGDPRKQQAREDLLQARANLIYLLRQIPATLHDGVVSHVFKGGGYLAVLERDGELYVSRSAGSQETLKLRSRDFCDHLEES